MLLWAMLVLMLLAAAIGGLVNFLLPANATDNKPLRPLWQCTVLGLGATLLVPIFLELAQSKLMENIVLSLPAQKAAKDTATSAVAASAKPNTLLVVACCSDSGQVPARQDTLLQKAIAVTPNAAVPTTPAPANDLGKSYLLWMAYCLLAAAAGFRFIDMIISKVGAAKELSEVKNEVQQVKKAAVKQAKTDVAEQDEKATALLQPVAGAQAADNLLPPIPLKLPAVTHWDDPQKGRFGGVARRNNRLLEVLHIEELPGTDGLCRFALRVKSTSEQAPLTGDVIFYLHNTFSPSVIAKPAANNQAMLHLSAVYGAFTVGGVADGGRTLLELDLASNTSFPQRFRDR